MESFALLISRAQMTRGRFRVTTRESKDTGQVRRLLALAAIYDRLHERSRRIRRGHVSDDLPPGEPWSNFAYRHWLQRLHQ